MFICYNSIAKTNIVIKINYFRLYGYFLPFKRYKSYSLEFQHIKAHIYRRFGNVWENLIFANIREFLVSRIQSPCLYRLIKLIGLRWTAVRLSLEPYFSQLKEVSILYYQMKLILTNFCG